MARKVARTVYLSPSLSAWADRRVVDISHPYENLSALINGLLLYDRAVGVPHEVISELMSKPERIRDAIIEKLEQDPAVPAWMRDKMQEIISAALREHCAKCDLKKQADCDKGKNTNE